VDPITLVVLGAMAWLIKERVKDVRRDSTARATRIEGRRTGRGPHGTHSPEALSRLPHDRRGRRTDPRPGRNPLDQPIRAARLGSRIAAALTTYPALAWMIPAAAWRGLRYGRTVGRHYRRNGGDLDDARRTAAEEAHRRGWHIPGVVRPAGPGPAGPGAGTAPGTDPGPDAEGPAPATVKVDVLPGPHVQPPAGTPADDGIADAEIVIPRTDGTTNPKGPNPMSSDLSPVNGAAVAALETGDYETIIAMAQLGAQAAASLAEYAAEIKQRMEQYSTAVEAIHADAAGMHLDPESQGDLVIYQEGIANIVELHGRLAAEADWLGEWARQVQTNLETRHGGIHDAVQDAPVAHAADSAFYGKAAI
jgi:hypothetical protein